MHSFKKILLVTIVAFLLTACKNDIDFSELIDKDSPLIISIYFQDKRTFEGEERQFEVLPGTEDYEAFIEWVKGNEQGWNTTYAVYEPRGMISQDNFELNYMGYFVVLKYKDQKGKSHRYNKVVGESSLDFLFD